ncbi:MAG: MerR family transcriptional regulator [Symbiobacteriaceae bacterium]|nr:MerR family transcriptional regulator [Symbiobacteriaceae bacterium]
MLRHYNEIGLLTPVYVDAFTAYRYYSAEQLAAINRIQTLKEMGFSLATIKEIIETYNDTDSLRSYLKIQRSQMIQEAAVAEKRLLLLENALQRIGDDSFMSTVVTVKEIPQRYVASLRKVIPTYSDESMLWELMGSETGSLGMHLANPCYSLAVFHDEGYKETEVEVEIQLSVTGTYADTENVRFKEVSPITVASAVVNGSYDQLTPVYEAIATWVTGNDYDFNGAMFCIYHVSPAQDPNPDNWVTEVCFPVIRK